MLCVLANTPFLINLLSYGKTWWSIPLIRLNPPGGTNLEPTKSIRGINLDFSRIPLQKIVGKCFRILKMSYPTHNTLLHSFNACNVTSRQIISIVYLSLIIIIPLYFIYFNLINSITWRASVVSSDLLHVVINSIMVETHNGRCWMKKYTNIQDICQLHGL